MMVDEAVDPVRDIGVWEDECELVLVSEALEDLRSGREVWRLLVPSCTYEGLLALIMFPAASLHSLFLVASIPSPSPPASSSFSLWRAMCRSLEYVRPSYANHYSETYRVGHDGGNEHYNEDMYYCRLCDSMRDGEDVQIWKMTFHSLDECIQTFS